MTKKTVNSRGRPKVTLNDLPKGWKETIISLMSEGASKVEIKAELKMSCELFDRLMREEPDFSIAVKEGEQLSKAWWERMGRKNLMNKEFSPVLWYMNMKNRFGWRDKQEVEHSGNVENPVVVVHAGANPYK